MSLRKVLYTAEASTDGGREGVVRSSDGRLEVSLSVPVELRGAGGDGTNPEQLFAAGYAACYQSALFLVAAGRKIDISGSRVTVRVGLGPTGTGGMGLAVQLDFDACRAQPGRRGRPDAPRIRGLSVLQRDARKCRRGPELQGVALVRLHDPVRLAWPCPGGQGRRQSRMVITSFLDRLV